MSKVRKSTNKRNFIQIFPKQLSWKWHNRNRSNFHNILWLAMVDNTKDVNRLKCTRTVSIWHNHRKRDISELDVIIAWMNMRPESIPKVWNCGSTCTTNREQWLIGSCSFTYHMHTSETFVNANGIAPASRINRIASESTGLRMFRRSHKPPVCSISLTAIQSFVDIGTPKNGFSSLSWSAVYLFEAISSSTSAHSCKASS